MNVYRHISYALLLVSIIMMIRILYVNDYRHDHFFSPLDYTGYSKNLAYASKQPPLLSTGEKVVLLVLDGARQDMLYDETICPNIVSLWKQTGIRYTSVTTMLPSVSAPNYYSLYSGAPPWLHGVTNNIRRAPYFQQGDTLFDLCGGQKVPPLTIGFEWYKQMFGHSSRYIPAECCERADSGEVARLLSEEIVGETLPSFTAVHFLAPDCAGHATNSSNSTRYVASISEIDRLVGRLYPLLHAKYPAARLIITADHGMNIDGNHGGSDPLSLVVPLYVLAPGHDGGEATRPVTSLSLAPTISAMLGLHVPPLSSGTLLREVIPAEKYMAYLQKSIDQKEKLLAALTGSTARSMILLEDEEQSLQRHEKNLSTGILGYFENERGQLLVPQRVIAVILLCILVAALVWNLGLPASFLLLNGLYMGMMTGVSVFIISKHLYTMAISGYLLLWAIVMFAYFRFYFPFGEFQKNFNGGYIHILTWLTLTALALSATLLPLVTFAPHPDIFMVRFLNLLLLHPFIATITLFITMKYKSQ
ncbi:MAG: alkaline phosphatase family protein [Spirochaetota bacterium]